MLRGLLMEFSKELCRVNCTAKMPAVCETGN